ncbi:lamin tail domain-containing protein [Lentimicrobium sp. S6]|uniref:lamin tail domain-containing protein n=1 Tax=Lentimicrobium sp. S6 TaxID=2735872 RepID=UPI001554DB0B|nr:lamin tail domain-containing protein [Lentimicrobium sp. S6]NPD44179.1 PKD domain-containing protein [Lentimicrobium sp. S6]
MKKFTTLLLMLLMFIGTSSQAQDLVISGVYDGPRSGGTPKGVELYVLANIADLSVYGLGSANNGGGSDGEEFTFPADAASAGSFIYVATEDVEFANWFGFAPNYTDGSMAINGDDAVELFMNSTVIDVFGDINQSGSGQPWEYLDGWAYRTNGSGPDGSNFELGNFSYSGPNVWDGEGSLTNATSATPFPVGTYTAGAATTVSTPIISPASGDYFAPITVTMTCGTDDAAIYYTTNGSNPTQSSTLYTAGFSVSSNKTVKARAYKTGLTESAIATNNYAFPSVTDISNISQLRSQTVGDDYYQLTGEAILTYQQSYRGQKYIQDATAAIFIDDLDGNITTTYDLYDGITGIIGSLNLYEGMLQFIPISDPGAASSTANSITPEVVTLDDLLSDFQDYQAELIKVENAIFVDAGADFENGTIYAITDGSKGSFNFRTTFYDVDYIGTAIPAGAQDLIMLANTTDPENDDENENFVTSRSSLDINPASSANPATQLDITSINGGNAVNENQAFTVTVQAQDDDGDAANVDADLAVTLSLGTGTGNLGGTLTGTIAAGTSTITISGVTYGPHESGVVLNVTGGGLESGSSAPFNVLEVIIPEIVISEIMYNAMPGSDTLEYIEFYNNGSSAINLDGYQITEGVEHTFESYNLAAGAYVLVAVNASAIQDAFGKDAIEWTSGGLSNNGEDVNLLDASGNEVTYVDFGVSDPWPAKEVGKSIRFCNPGLANNDPANWSISVELLATIGGQDIYGTPLASCGVAPLVAEFSASSTSIETGQSIDFTDLSTGNPTSWSWTFEGGTPSSSTSQNPQDIVYNTAGVYDVILTISTDDDNNTETKTNYITVVDPITPPIAAFTANLTTIFVGQSVQFTSTSANDPDTYSWTFEGGTPATSSNQNPNISYSTAGIYDVSLTVANGGGSNELVEMDYITVLPATLGDLVITEIMYNPPEAGDDVLEYIEIYNNSEETVDLIGYNFTAGIEYTFPTMDLASGAYVLVAKDANAMQTVLGITALQWTSGSLSNSGELIKLSSPTGITIDSIPYAISSPWPEDGNGNGPSIAICDPEVENSIGENWHASTKYLTDNAGDAIYGSPGTASAPVAHFSANETSIFITEDVQFTNLSTCNYTSIEWTFEGGTPSTSSDENPVVSYDNEGVFDVTLTVTNAIGSHTIEMVDYIEVIDPTIAPIANFSANLTTIFVGQSVLYTDLSENEPVTYSWTFEGGTPVSSSLQNPSVTYNAPGIFDVTLFVENTAGDDEMVKTDYITVLPATVGDLVITEIMYNPPESGDDSLEYIEIYNNSANIVNLLGYTFSDGVEFTFPNMSLAINDYLVIAKNANAMQNTLGVTAIEWTSGSLSNGGELIKIISASGITVDSVPYSDMTPWPEDGDGTGPSITICDPEAENSVGENWHASVNYLADNTNGDAIYGTPGTGPVAVANFTANDQLPSVGGQVEFTELSTCNAESFEWTFEGGTPGSSTEPNPSITYAMAGDFDVTLTVTNAIGSHTITLEEYIRVGVGIAEQTLAEISIMPNPSTGLFTLENPSNNEISAVVYNVLGKLVYEKHSVLSHEVIDLTREESGIYLLQLSIDGEYKTMRIIKQ